ncbi:Uma2 family endonuclease [Streptomyces chrestomyceticus]|uniref:Uma2 family endonuclease n=1 Tax=Streptomyces chrestomyceticus TaxID=68185 RepID=UPI0036A1422E
MAAEADQGPGERATPDNWMCPPPGGWTYDQVKDLESPDDWELLDGNIVARGMAVWKHNYARDQLFCQLESGCREPFAVNVEQGILINDCTALKPDVVVFDASELDIDTVTQIPVEKVALVVEVMSEGSRSADQDRKPTLYAKRGVRSYWRIEWDEGGLPVMHEYWLDQEMGLYAPSPDGRIHTEKLVTSIPYPVEIDLRALVRRRTT